MEAFNNSSKSLDICPYSCSFLGVTKLDCGYIAVLNELMILLNCMFSPVTALANALVLVAIYRHPTIHSPANILLAGLAFSDMIVGLFIEPVYIASLVSAMNNRVHLSCVLREFCYRANFFFTPFSFLVVVCISLERWLALHMRTKFKQMVTNRRIIKLLFIICVFCLFINSTWSWLPSTACFSIAFAGVTACLIINIAVYTNIFIVLRSCTLRLAPTSMSGDSRRSICSSTARFKKSVITALYIVFALCFCSFPYLVRNSLRVTIDYTVEMFITDHLTVSVLMTNSLINPFLYFWRNAGIRKASKTCSKKMLLTGFRRKNKVKHCCPNS